MGSDNREARGPEVEYFEFTRYYVQAYTKDIGKPFERRFKYLIEGLERNWIWRLDRI